MLIEILLAIVQAATEFLPISSDGHLALFSNLYGTPDLSLFIFLHLASSLAVIIFTRKEIVEILKFKKENNRYLFCILLGIIPVGIAGIFLKSFVETQINSLLITGIGFLFTGFMLLMTKNTFENRELGVKSAFFVGIMQIFALMPGISRSGITISTAKFFGIKNQEAFKFSFLMLIPLTLGAFILDIGKIINYSSLMIIPFFVCLFTSLLFLSILKKIVIRNKFWMFSFYCIFAGIISSMIYFFA
jgi:undecaprenyl-diphosphatase